MFDIVIRGGTVIDGTGAPPRRADIAIEATRIVEVGKDLGQGRREVDASDRIVAPGWVDIHSHYDGQALWDPLLSPSGAHGVTTTVFGNCGVGFAPVRPGDHDALIAIMEGVEDIPGTALAEGLPWNWETFPEYVDALAEAPRVMDVAVLVPHSAVRAYVMGADESIRDVASTAQCNEMGELVRDAVRTGAIGLSTSRTKLHLAADGRPVPGSFAEMEELLVLAEAVKDGGGGMIQAICDWSPDAPDREFAWLRRLSTHSGQPVSFSLIQYDETPNHHRRLLELVAEARADNVPIHAGVGIRPVGMLINLESKVHPFSGHPSFAPIAELPLAEKLRRLRDPALRARLLTEETTLQSRFWRPRMQAFDRMFPLGDPVDYEPDPSRSLAAVARRRATTGYEVVLDLLTSGDGSQWIYFPLMNYADQTLEPQLAMMRDPGTVISLADGGAHCGLICDASSPTFQLTHWVMGRERGPRLELAEAVHLQTGRPARRWGFVDRGVIQPGRRADVNVIDLDRLALCPPRWAADLPAGGRRLLQDAQGYELTMTAGQVTWEHGEPTGARPGTVVRRIRPTL